jgi:hypothetical protein
MHEAHRKAAELHELAAQSHRTAAEHNEKGDCATSVWHSERALEYADHSYLRRSQVCRHCRGLRPGPSPPVVGRPLSTNF